MTGSYNLEPSAAVLADDNYSRKEADWRAPGVEPDEMVIFDEPGRILTRERPGGVDCRSHYFRVTKPRFDAYQLRVRHAAGEKVWKLDYSIMGIDALGSLDSDARYRLLWLLMAAHHDSEWAASEATAQRYRDAFVSGRLKKHGPRVWIEPKPRETSA